MIYIMYIHIYYVFTYTHILGKSFFLPNQERKTKLFLYKITSEYKKFLEIPIDRTKQLHSFFLKQ